MNLFVILAAAGLLIGLVIAGVLALLVRRQQIQQAQRQAEEMIEEARQKATQIEEEGRQRAKEYEKQTRRRFEKESKRKVQRNRSLEEKVKERQKKIHHHFSDREDLCRKRESLLQKISQKVEGKDQAMRGKIKKQKQLHAEYIQQLLTITEENEEALKEKISQRLENETRTRLTKQLQIQEEEHQQDLEKTARRIINSALARFARPYCPERGIGSVAFPNEEVRDRVVGPDQIHLKALEKACGVDISLSSENLTASVLGFDPVRRELGRASLEKLIHERSLSSERVNEIVQKTKKDLFRKIRNDGDRLAKELRLQGLHEEIRNMMGALRYRYSFAQNQYFHCSEVGWLCGLLSAELGLDVKEGRRAGMLHDIGKAMDHSIDGGHAVIGADFINKHDEEPHIVHAVRAHHYDETPDSDLAFLVIAADAISGARPGARRSTIDSYTQKMADLEKIGNSFKGVLNTYILSAGREVRLIVDSGRVDDFKALELSRDVAQKIEAECSYPGLIKVTVVRETQAVEFAK